MNNAQKIAEMILQCDTDYRGNLLKEIGEILNQNSQWYTGSLFLDIATEYGIKSDDIQHAIH